MEISIVVTIVTSIFSVLLGIVGYLLHDLRTTIKEDINEHEAEIDELKKEIADDRADMPRKFVMRDDFLRAISNLDSKIDNVSSEISEMNKTLSKVIGGDRSEKSS